MSNKLILTLIFILFLFKIVAIYFTGFNLYGDEAQYWIWAKSPDVGYFSKPPLLAWFLFGYTGIFGDSFFLLKTFPLFVYFFISLTIFKLCLLLNLSKSNSFFCAASFLVMPAASLSSFIISTDLLLLLFWSLSLIMILQIRIAGTNLRFFLLGSFLGLSFLAKYAGIYFLICLVVLFIVDKKTLRSFKNNLLGVLIFFSSFVMVLLPNIYWNLNNNWITLSHTSGNANLQNLNLNIYEPLEFLGSQILMVGPLLFLGGIFFIKNKKLNQEDILLIVFSLPIIFIVLIESFLVRANANWAAPALISIFILLFRVLVNNGLKILQINFIINYLLAIFLFGLILTSSKNSFFDRVRGIDVFVEQISSAINDGDLVVSDRILFSNIFYEMRNKKNKIYMTYRKGDPITNHFQMSSPLKKGYDKKFFIIGDLSDIEYMSQEHRGELLGRFNVPFHSEELKLYEVSNN